MQSHSPNQHDPDAHDEHIDIAPLGALVAVFGGLLVLTWVTVAATWVDLGMFNMAIALLIAVVKASLVALFFMHLRWDNPFNGLVLLGALAFVALLISFAMFDVAEYHSQLRPLAETISFEPAAAEADNNAPADEDPLVAKGRQLYNIKGCYVCHTTDGSKPPVATSGPTWKGIYGSTETMRSGETVTVDDDYIRESINEPHKKIVKGYQPTMMLIPMTDEEIDAIIAFMKSL